MFELSGVNCNLIRNCSRFNKAKSNKEQLGLARRIISFQRDFDIVAGSFVKI